MEQKDDICDFCHKEGCVLSCDCSSAADVAEKKEHDIWDKTFCPDGECLLKSGTELV